LDDSLSFQNSNQPEVTSLVLKGLNNWNYNTNNSPASAPARSSFHNILYNSSPKQGKISHRAVLPVKKTISSKGSLGKSVTTQSENNQQNSRPIIQESNQPISSQSYSIEALSTSESSPELTQFFCPAADSSQNSCGSPSAFFPDFETSSISDIHNYNIMLPFPYYAVPYPIDYRTMNAGEPFSNHKDQPASSHPPHATPAYPIYAIPPPNLSNPGSCDPSAIPTFNLASLLAPPSAVSASNGSGTTTNGNGNGTAIVSPSSQEAPQFGPGPPIITGERVKGPRGCNLFVFHLPNEITNW
jgi:hypothetical protein